MATTKSFRLRVKDGYVSPATKMTNAHNVDMANVIIPAAVGVAIIKKQLDWKDVLCCVASGKDPTVLLKTPDAIKPREELQNAPDYKQETAAEELREPEPPAESEMVLARKENRAPDLAKLTEEELKAQAALVGVDPKAYSTINALRKAIQKKMDAIGNG